ncbi:MAG TPA: WD40 repeat domain-containing protein, partial [Pirellulaceae bacterium]|nr:WD40 repeat domain-containing protein [Pirellulaceae bacterium]
EIHRLPGHGDLGGRRAVVFTPDGQTFHSFGDDFWLRTFDFRTGKVLAEHQFQPDPDPSIDVARFSPDGRHLVIGIGLGKLYIFDVATGKEVRILENDGSHIRSVDFSPDSRLLLASASGKQQQIPLPDGGTRDITANEQPVTIWDVETGTCVNSLLLSGKGVGIAIFTPDGEQFAVVSRQPNRRITVYGLDGKERYAIDDIPHPVLSLAFTPDGTMLIGGLNDTSALVWDLKQFDKR